GRRPEYRGISTIPLGYTLFLPSPTLPLQAARRREWPASGSSFPRRCIASGGYSRRGLCPGVARGVLRLRVSGPLPGHGPLRSAALALLPVPFAAAPGVASRVPFRGTARQRFPASAA